MGSRHFKLQQEEKQRIYQKHQWFCFIRVSEDFWQLITQQLLSWKRPAGSAWERLKGLPPGECLVAMIQKVHRRNLLQVPDSLSDCCFYSHTHRKPNIPHSIILMLIRTLARVHTWTAALKTCEVCCSVSPTSTVLRQLGKKWQWCMQLVTFVTLLKPEKR